MGIGWVDMARMWVNPTFLWAELVGGFLLGVGFIMSGLCPGTSIVSAASGRWDGLATIGGIFVGTFLFTLAVDWVPGLEALYHGGSLGVSVLPAVLGLPTLPFVLGVVVVAGTAFVGAEMVERAYGAPHEPVELTPAPLPLAKFGLAGALALVLFVGLGLRPGPAAAPSTRTVTEAPITPLALARRIIAGDPDLIILDVRRASDDRIPGSYPAAPDSTAAPILAGAGAATDVVLVTDDGRLEAVPGTWPTRPHYHVLRGGWAGWNEEVLTPATPASTTAAELDRVREQNGISAFFSGAGTLAPQVSAPPPVIPQGGGAAKPKRGGC